MERLALACGGVAMNSVDELGRKINTSTVGVVNLGIKYSSYADLRINSFSISIDGIILIEGSSINF